MIGSIGPVNDQKKARNLIYVCMTSDVEIEDEEGLNEFKQILELLARFHLKATFFLLLSPHNYHFFEDPDIQSYFGVHEFGLHIHWGESNMPETSEHTGLQSLSIDILERELIEGLDCCKKLGFVPTTFRGGGLCQTTSAMDLISRHGFKVDSSVAAKLNEAKSWFQEHKYIPYRSWYFPSKRRYDTPANDVEDRIGILEIPVTRLIPSLSSWWPYTLTPNTPYYRLIVNEWLLKSWWEKPLLLTPLFHSWGGGDMIGKEFGRFLPRLSEFVSYLLSKHVEPKTMSEIYDLLIQH